MGEHMIDKCNDQRRADGLQPVEETRAAHAEPTGLVAKVDVRRVTLGLDAIAELRRNGAEPATLLIQQKEDTVARLAKVAQPTPGTLLTLQSLRNKCVPFVIATTSGKPRVPVCVDAAGMRVGSASNAGIGLIVGYVGAGHIAPELQKAHAQMLMAGEKAQNKRGADIVISQMQDLPQIVDQFANALLPNPGCNVCTPSWASNLSINSTGTVFRRE